MAAELKKIEISYFALLREQRGMNTETLETSASSLRELYTELKARHRFSLDIKMLRAALNDTFVDWDAPIREGDRVVFIPPVAGG